MSGEGPSGGSGRTRFAVGGGGGGAGGEGDVVSLLVLEEAACT